MSTAEDVAALKSLLADKYLPAINSNDTEGLAALFTDDSVLMPPNEPALAGKEAIRSWLRAFFEQLNAKITADPMEVEVAGDWAFMRPSYSMTTTPKAGGEQTADSGKSLGIYTRQPDGSWKIYRLIYNSDNPLPGTGS